MSVRRWALVTGATGFVGGHLARRLLDDGWSVRLLVRDARRLDEDLAFRTQVVPGDLMDRGSLNRAVAGVDVVFHCAANVATWGVWADYADVNITGTEKLLAAISAETPHLLRLVHLSTVDVYGYPDSPADETRELSNAGFGYGESKRLGEAAVRQWAETSGIPTVILRPCNIIGPGSQFIERIGKELQSGLMITIGGGRAHAGLLHVGNLIDRMLWAAEAPVAVGRTYNVRNAEDMTWAEFLRQFKAAIKGRGMVLPLSYGLAETAARGFEAVHRVIAPRHEPLLHRLIVRMFGKTCGHSPERILADSGMADRVGLTESIAQSAKWYLGRG
ncbi:NAD-dependent epimerase/dehydratase family protein [Oryzibacter oryziterrae]|uniref:NAD-dependent epimerase/dehydratase family protein n=1 Tax=Oryzibacter oryziterrae TaxID=2766474 RepID=UPI001F023AE2|nr:NAD-dependent epimerase/dehydratase family protein [Oryzibacter oryziterrae]